MYSFTCVIKMYSFIFYYCLYGDVFTKVFDFIGSIFGALGFTNKDSDTPIIVNNGCERKNSTYFICCVEYKALICFEGQYLVKEIGLEVALIINHKIYWQETISETNPPEVCPIDYPDVGEICFKFYDVQIREQHFCLNLSIKLDVIHRIPLKKIHVGCYDGKKDLPKPLNCTVNNTTENSFDINCQEEENQLADKSFWLEVIDSNALLVENETALTPKFVVSELHPGSVYYVHIYAKNKFGYSLPTFFNITTKQKPLDLPKPLNCTVNNTTENSFDLNCQEEETQLADKSFWLEVIDSNTLLVENETALTPKFVVSELHPGSVYYVHIYAKNKFGYSLPTVFNITTKQKPLEKKLTNAVVNIYAMYALLAMGVLFLIVVAVGIALKRTNSLQRSNELQGARGEPTNAAIETLDSQNLPQSSKLTLATPIDVILPLTSAIAGQDELQPGKEGEPASRPDDTEEKLEIQNQPQSSRLNIDTPIDVILPLSSAIPEQDSDAEVLHTSWTGLLTRFSEQRLTALSENLEEVDSIIITFQPSQETLLDLNASSSVKSDKIVLGDNNSESSSIDGRLEENLDPDWEPSENSKDHESSEEEENGNTHAVVIRPGNQPILEEANMIQEPENELNGTSRRKRRGRKRKIENETKEIRKKRRNSNLNYHNYKGTLVESKKFHAFECKCNKKCYTLVPEDVRKTEFEKFWNLGNYNSQNMFIGACVNEVHKKRQYTNKPSKRNFVRMYMIRSIPVCRDQFVKTFGISTKRVNTALSKLRSDDLRDKRGQEQGGKNKIPDQQFEEVRYQINSIPKYKSHYRRGNTDSEFLPPEMTLQKMYDTYVKEKIEKAISGNSDVSSGDKDWEECSENEKKAMLRKVGAVSLSSYRRIFLNSFDLKFKKLKKDTCNKCDSFASRISVVGAAEKRILEEEHDKHLSFSEEARKNLKDDTEKAKKTEDFECLTFDLEKTLPLPRIPSNIIFYKRQLWLYNAGVHSGKSSKGYCYLWTENEAGRGAQEIGSCLIKHIANYVGNQVKHLVLWCDSCGGQNRNIKIVLMLKSCLETHPSLETIKIKYLIPGHTFLPNDSDFSDIECALKHIQRLYLPEDYISVIKQSRRKNPFVITRMKSADFSGTENLEKKIVNRKTTDCKEPIKINWLQIREICLKKEDPMKMYCRSDFSSEYNCVDFARKTKKGEVAKTVNFNNSLVPMWVGGKEIAAPKLKDLKSIMHLIPSDAKVFYQRLTGSRAVEDDIDGFCGSLDFEIEDETD